MTAEDRYIKKDIKVYINIAGAFLLLIPALLFSEVLREGVIYGIRLSAFGVLPSIFPFFIIADALGSMSFGTRGIFSRIFEKIFSISGEGARAFIIGNVCGFPLGVKLSSELYESGVISKKEAERLIGISNNPSLAYVISGVGVGIIGSLKAGVSLYISIVISTALVGLVFRRARVKNSNLALNSRQRFDFVQSVKSAGLSSLSVCSYIIFFSAITNLLRFIVGDGLVGTVLTSILEVSGGVSFVSHSEILSDVFLLPCLSFILGFSGFSVHMQARSVASNNLSFKKYYVMKVLEGLISSSIVIPVYILLGR